MINGNFVADSNDDEYPELILLPYSDSNCVLIVPRIRTEQGVRVTMMAFELA
jgi:hypothetical protein